MATYKVIQDIEAEDKLIGPLTLRQFIYAIITLVSGFLAFKLGTVNFLFIFPFLPFILFFGALAAPLGRDQSTEVWLLAKIRFFLKPRRRIWDQSGIKELVTITAPKRVERILTKNLSATEVKSRLEALANTIDSRGWAVKNVNINLYSQPSYVGVSESDRLIDPSSLPQDVSGLDIQAADDMLDERSNPTAQHFDQMVAAVSRAHKQQAVAGMQQAAPGNPGATPPPDYWFMRGPSAPANLPAGMASFQNTQVVAPGTGVSQLPASTLSPEEEKALLEKIHLDKSLPNPAYGHMKVLDPSGKKKSFAKKKKTEDKTKVADPITQQLAGNDNLYVDTIAREAQKAKKRQASGEDEVVVNLR
jgi:hypothetical protein